ncbi:hypothetical protein BH10PSE5_BH10PSE5_18170 [soil metagenome]
MTDSAEAPAIVPYEFSRDWFSRNVPTWRQIIDKNKPRRILEIGSFEGRSTVWMIEHGTVAAQGDVEITCIDTWVGGIMIVDDYLWSMDRPGTQDMLTMPKPAIDAFMNIFMGAPDRPALHAQDQRLEASLYSQSSIPSLHIHIRPI